MTIHVKHVRVVGKGGILICPQLTTKPPVLSCLTSVPSPRSTGSPALCLSLCPSVLPVHLEHHLLTSTSKVASTYSQKGHLYETLTLRGLDLWKLSLSVTVKTRREHSAFLPSMVRFLFSLSAV